MLSAGSSQIAGIDMYIVVRLESVLPDLRIFTKCNQEKIWGKLDRYAASYLAKVGL